MRTHRIYKKETSTSDWEHVRWVEKEYGATLRELDKEMVASPDSYKWKIVPYRVMEDDTREFFRRV